MKYELLTAISLLLISCGQPAESGVSSEPAAGPAPTLPEEPAPSAMKMEGVELRMYDFERTDGELQKPTFFVHADAAQLAEGEKVWSLQKAVARIFREDGEDFHIEALEGQFDDARKEAVLKGAVRLTAGSLTIDLEDITWKNEENTASSDNPVHLTNGDTRLDAQNIRIDVETGTLTLGEASGFIQFTESTL